ncbi:MAG: Coenzyme F420 hydrogenase/dehydrogenase, beta subunit C-terminal domain [Muribaculaceae bacterium]|nr:Coenzyme F420 hydrogenase/dehydrogenase, beta subunit C-terminal domain [Muribaculaceae bacterium]
MNNNRLPILCNNFTCTGCGACENSCPLDAIKLEPNEEGFLNPIIDNTKCIGCLKCEKSCPIINNKKPKTSNRPKVYATWNKNKNIRKESSSGGVFSALAEAIIEKGGVVCGAAYDNNMNVNHIIINSIDDIKKLRGSKYVQSNINKIFREIKKHLENNTLVLFVGTPCQTYGLKSYLKKDYHNLILCSFICHGVPSQLLFKKYISWLEKRHKKNICNFEFRNKKIGWTDSVRKIYFNDGTNTITTLKEDSYYCLFGKRHNTHRECCYNCKMKNLNEHSDITLGDFWGIGEKYNLSHKKAIIDGISACIILSSKGDKIFHYCNNENYIFTEPRYYKELQNRNPALYSSAPRDKTRNTIYKDLKTKKFSEFIKKYYTITYREYVIYILRKYFSKIIIYIKILKLK